MASITCEWVDVQIQSTLDAGEVLGLLDDPTVPGAWQEGRTIHLYWPCDRWSPDHLAHLRQTLRRLTERGVPEPEIVAHSLPAQDWNRRWAEAVKPLRIGTRIVIRPSWERLHPEPHQIEIVLDPKQAFGTGHHATTGLLLEWLEEDIRGGESVCDVGTGSGLLAMVALRLGATTAFGIDHDPEAIECARGYAAANGFGQELSLQHGTLTAGHAYDLVLANLDRRTLIELAEPLAARTGRTLLVSGVLADQRDEVVREFSRAGLYPGRQRERDGWLAMEFTKADSCEGISA